MRIFRATFEVYEQVRAQLDSAYGYPNYETKTTTAIPPAAEQEKDADGRVYLVVSDEFCGYEMPTAMLPQLLASGAVEEIDAATYTAEARLAARPAT